MLYKTVVGCKPVESWIFYCFKIGNFNFVYSLIYIDLAKAKSEASTHRKSSIIKPRQGA